MCTECKYRRVSKSGPKKVQILNLHKRIYKITRIFMPNVMQNLVFLLEPSEYASYTSFKAAKMCLNRFVIDEDAAFELSEVNYLKKWSSLVCDYSGKNINRKADFHPRSIQSFDIPGYKFAFNSERKMKGTEFSFLLHLVLMISLFYLFTLFAFFTRAVQRRKLPLIVVVSLIVEFSSDLHMSHMICEKMRSKTFSLSTTAGFLQLK